MASLSESPSFFESPSFSENLGSCRVGDLWLTSSNAAEPPQSK